MGHKMKKPTLSAGQFVLPYQTFINLVKQQDFTELSDSEIKSVLFEDDDDTGEALRLASTEAEETKLQATFQAQFTQLQDLNQQVLLSAADAQVKQAEVAAMKDAEVKTNAEARTVLAQQEANKITSAYTTNYQCALQFVEERPLSP